MFYFGNNFIRLLYWRQQTVNNERLRQAQLEKEQSLQSKEKFIKVVAPIAQRADKPYGLFPSVTIAQACLESNFGQSELSRKYNNLFGVKERILIQVAS